MQPDPFDPENGYQVEPDDEQEKASPYSLATITIGLLMALSLLGSLLWRAFPPSILFREENPGLGPLATPGVKVSVPVGGSAGWVDSGLEVETGAGYLISARGQIQFGEQFLEGQTIGPQGYTSPCQPREGRSCPFEGAPFGALVARIGSNRPFLVGAGLLLEPEDEGRLWLSANDREGEFSDNQGTFLVSIERTVQDSFEVALSSPMGSCVGGQRFICQ